MTIQITAFAALLLCMPVLADDVSDRAKLLSAVGSDKTIPEKR